MKLRKKKIVFLIGLSIIIALLNINFIGFSYKSLSNEEDVEIRNDTKIKTSDYWVENPIYIDDTVSGSDWAWAVGQVWCSFVNGFYVIENVTINGDNSSNCIHIKNSNVPFIIRNCTFYNSSKSMGYGGISLENVNNSQIINNNCSFNNGHGIRVYFSYNNTLLGNIANNNSINGIYMETTQNNTFLGNILINHWNGSGIGGWWNNNNTISGNTLNNNIFGIFLGECTNNTISGNIEINENMLGIYLHKSNNTDVYGNTINSNGYGIALEMSNYTIVIGNVLIGNGMCIIESEAKENVIKWNNCEGEVSPSIYIRDIGGGNFTWAEAAKYLAWVSGSGTWKDPYIIEDITINGNNSTDCILVRDSSVYFIIRDCTLFNASAGAYQAGIKLENVNNSQIIDNNCSFNNREGIHLESSFNNTVSGNIANNNPHSGIFLIESENNTLSENTACYNTGPGIYLMWSSNNNTLSGNTANYNDQGIELFKSNNNAILTNIASGNDYAGIRLDESNYTKVIGNTLNGNTYCISEYDSKGNIFMANNCSGIISSFIIDDSGGTSGALTWVQAAKFIPFCNGSGTWDDPYIIEDITINGENSSSCIAIRESSKYFIIRDCTIINSSSGWGYGGIALFRVNNGMISNNNCTSNYEAGIAIIESHNNTISNNKADNNFGMGMNIWYSDNNAISENTLNDNKGGAGMYILESSNNIISGNTITYNDYGVQSDGNSNDFIGNIINFNDVGLQIHKSNDSVISDNTINNNNFAGLVLNRVNNSIFSDNTIYNSNEGLGLDGCNNNTFFNNDIIENDVKGVSLIEESGKCENNLFYNNNFTNPAGINAVDNGTNNRWDNGELGNYWHDYAGKDKNDDGIGDTPYDIPGSAGSQDNFPIWDDGPEPTKKDLTWIIVTVIISIVGGIAVVAAIAIIYLRKRTKT